jgi:hypothetical protein
MRPGGLYGLALGVTWIALAFVKVTSPGVLAAHIESALGWPAHWTRAAAWSIIAGEATLGVSILLRGRLSWAHVPVVVSLVASAAMVAVALLTPATASPCGCFGSLADSTEGRRVVVAGVLLFLGASTLLGKPTGIRSGAHVVRSGTRQ